MADFLRVIGAYRALLELESGRVVKSMRNQVNRLVNCDTANLEKVVATAHKQLALIEEAEERIGLHNLPPLFAGGGPPAPLSPRGLPEGAGGDAPPAPGQIGNQPSLSAAGEAGSGPGVPGRGEEESARKSIKSVFG